jgi:NAD(P)-dependent dehydrogenase (short-subunit alcohol dehydrogenase family)
MLPRPTVAARYAKPWRVEHLLVNNAGIAWGGVFEGYPKDTFARLMKVNVTAVFVLIRDLTALLERAASADDPLEGSISALWMACIFRLSTTSAPIPPVRRHCTT